jgi:hypothetical protein
MPGSSVRRRDGIDESVSQRSLQSRKYGYLTTQAQNAAEAAF